MVWAPAGSVVLAYDINDKLAAFRCVHTGTVGESVPVCAAWERLLRVQRMIMRVLRPLLGVFELRSSQYTRTHPLNSTSRSRAAHTGTELAHCASVNTAKNSQLVIDVVRQDNGASRRPYHSYIALGPCHQ